MDENADIEAMTLQQLEAEFVDLGHRLSCIDLRRRRIYARMQKLTAAARAKTRLATLTDAEKAALRAELGDAS